jgi:hypothetical protein
MEREDLMEDVLEVMEHQFEWKYRIESRGYRLELKETTLS